MKKLFVRGTYYMNGNVGLKLLSINAMYFITNACFMPFLAPFYRQMGLSTTEIGILIAIGPITYVCVQPLWAYLSDKTGRRKSILLGISACAGITILGFLTAKNFLTLLFFCILFYSFQTAMMPLCDALVTDQCIKEEVEFSKVRMGGTVGYAIVALILGLVINNNIRWMFPITTVSCAVFFYTISFLPKDEKAAPAQKNVKSNEKSGSIFTTNRIFAVLFIAFIMQIALAINGSFMPVMLADLGQGQNVIGLSNFISAMSEVPILIIINKLLKKYDTIKLMIFATVIMSLRLLLVSTGTVPIMLFTQLFNGITYMIISFSCITFVRESAAEGKMSQAQSTLAIVQSGLGATLGNILGGALSDAFGIADVLRLTSITLLAVIVIFALVYKMIFKEEKAAA